MRFQSPQLNVSAAQFAQSDNQIAIGRAQTFRLVKLENLTGAVRDHMVQQQLLRNLNQIIEKCEKHMWKKLKYI
jgi:hypothetical protein